MSSHPPSTKADFWHFPQAETSMIWLKNVENKFISL